MMNNEYPDCPFHRVIRNTDGLYPGEDTITHRCSMIMDEEIKRLASTTTPITKMICRSCGDVIDKPFLNLGNSPISNNFLTEVQTHKPETYYPLEVYHCQKCHLVQIRNYKRPVEIFNDDYAYFSSVSSSWLEHCKLYVSMITKRRKLNKKSFVLEIGSNDGYLLQYFAEKGIPVQGIDPAEKAAKIAIGKGIPTIIGFFDRDLALKTMQRKYDLIICNNVIAHNPNLVDFVQALGIALKDNGVITAEFPHLLKLMQGNQFDTIYQEHYSYFSLNAINKLFNTCGLEIFDVDELDTHGGSLRIYARHKLEQYDASDNFIKVMDDEMYYGLLDKRCYGKFQSQVERTKRELLYTLIIIKRTGRKIVGYGAPAKGNTLLNYCGIRTDFLDYVVDMAPSKQGKFLPGTHIPMYHPDQIKITKPDYILILPWNLKNEIIAQLSFVREWGCQFIVPIPEVEVL